MKVLLVHAYNIAADPGEAKVMKPYPPLGLLYLSAYLKREGHEVRVFDGTFKDAEELVVEAKTFGPEVVGFYANMMTRLRVLKLRKLLDGLARLFVVGGPDPPHYAQHYLDRGFDVVIVGEGERTMAQILAGENWQSIDGLIYRQDGMELRTSSRKPNLPLAELPFPDREAIDLNAYLNCWEKHHQMRPISLITSRGCPFQCTWCSHNVYGHSLRKRRPEAVVEEMEWLCTHYKFTHYWFADDVFNIQPKWLARLADLLDTKSDLKRPFECIARADRFDDTLVDVLKRMQCFRCWVGAESGSQRLLDEMKRGVTREQVARAVTDLRKAGIETGMFFMWGFGDETFSDVLETVSLAETCCPDIALTTVAYPIKGTAFHKSLSEIGRIGGEPEFTEGTDRDVAILNQAPRQAYALADQLLHARLQSRKLAQGWGKKRLKSVAHLLRAHYVQQKLARAFAQNI